MIEKLGPLNGHILVEHIDNHLGKTESGIFVVNNENARNATHRATVIKVNPLSALKPGDTIFYTVHTGGTEVRDGNKSYKFMREADLLASLSA